MHSTDKQSSIVVGKLFEKLVALQSSRKTYISNLIYKPVQCRQPRLLNNPTLIFKTNPYQIFEWKGFTERSPTSTRFVRALWYETLTYFKDTKQ